MNDGDYTQGVQYYNSVQYGTLKLKFMHVEDDIINIFPIIQNRNDYPRKEKNVDINPLWLFYMIGTFVTLLLMII